MPTRLYHREVYAPVPMFRSPGVVRVHYTDHAREQAETDRYGNMRAYLHKFIDFDEGEIVEVEVTDGLVSKRLVRIRATKELDLVLAVLSNGRVTTVWVNQRDDRHSTLNRSKYVQPIAAPARREPATEQLALA